MQATTIPSAQLKDYLVKSQELIDHYLELHLPPKTGPASRLTDAMRYSLFAGGKRIRPILALAVYELFGGQGQAIFYATSALEMIHTFSLIHDDLPCMDDDDFRRGKPTNHKAFDEATAVLAGDALCIRAFELLGYTGNANCVATLSRSLGTDGMLGGQMEDILCEGKQVTIEQVQFIHLHKTAALIEASLVMGAQLAGASEDQTQAIAQYGYNIGLAFQIVDDILDIVQTTETLGKDAGSDALREKATYPAVLGLEKSKVLAEELRIKAINALKPIQAQTTILEEMAEYIVKRIN